MNRMRFNCRFENADGESRAVVAALSASECESIERLKQHKGTLSADKMANTYATRHAYNEVPAGFNIIGDPVPLTGG